ncbi:hypothetical protein EVAR_36277_1 [Eumeta japonica]|uniref:Uncharacterized protein n=1 Tax=Eumeta variegata TaxID=151549 RepID=A0A4C1VKS2_EUMVA|nr:hypothetical protein EVAR_36277_1 [Eumeta japonica]
MKPPLIYVPRRREVAFLVGRRSQRRRSARPHARAPVSAYTLSPCRPPLAPHPTGRERCCRSIKTAASASRTCITNVPYGDFSLRITSVRPYDNQCSSLAHRFPLFHYIYVEAVMANDDSRRPLPGLRSA